jgi:dienelactone hydrolase
LVEAIRQGPDDAIRTIDVMLTRPEVNPKKINLLGTSLGGICAATAAGRDARIDKVILLLAGGGLDRIIGYSHETTRIREVINQASPADRKFAEDAIREVDPLNNIGFQTARAESGRLKMYNAAADEVLPEESVKALVEKSGMKGRNIMFPGLGHYTAIAALPRVLSEFVAFFRDDTVPERKPDPPEGDQALAKKVFTQLLGLAKFSPEPGHAIFIDAAGTVKNKDQLIAGGSLLLLRGDGRKLKLSVCSDQPLEGNIRKISLGFSEYPWLISGRGTIYQGELNPNEFSAATYLNSQIGAYQQMAVGLLAMAVDGLLEPLQQWCKVTIQNDSSGHRYLSVIVNRTDIKVFLKDATSIPEKITFATGDISGEVFLRQWQMNAPSETAAFNPSGADKAKVVQVNQQDLDRMLAAIVNCLVN